MGKRHCGQTKVSHLPELRHFGYTGQLNVAGGKLWQRGGRGGSHKGSS